MRTAFTGSWTEDWWSATDGSMSLDLGDPWPFPGRLDVFNRLASTGRPGDDTVVIRPGNTMMATFDITWSVA